MSKARQRCAGTRKANRTVLPLVVLDGSGLTGGVVRASRRGRWRAAVLSGVYLLIVAHALHGWWAGRTLSPIEPSESMATLERGEINAGFIFFSLALLSTLILGRWVCGWGCHIVALQDLCAWIMRKLGVRPQPFRSRVLVWVPLGAALYMFVWPTVVRWIAPPAGSAFPGFSSHLTTTEFWKTFPGVAVAVPFLLICGFAAVCFLGSKGYCTYACPYGGFFGLADRLAVGRIRVSDACDSCGHCTAVCTSNVRVHAEVRAYGMVVDPGCMKCLDCVSVCPQDALRFGFGRPSLAAPARRPRTAPPRYDLSWGEEGLVAVVFVAALLSVRGVYHVVPFLMALGIAALVAFGALKLAHLVRRPEVTLQNVRLKARGRLRPAGWGFAAAALALNALVAHSGLIQYHRFRGERAYRGTALPEEFVLAGSAPTPAIGTPEQVAAQQASRHLRFCDRWGLLATPDLLLQLAWCALLEKERAEALRYLQRAADLSPNEWRVAYYLGSVLSSLGRYAEAVDPYRQALAENPASAEARFKLGNALAEVGDLAGATAAWQTVLERRPEFAAARHNLAGALRQDGRLLEAVEQYRRALDTAPDDAESHFQLGATLTQLGDSLPAAEHFRRAVELNPRYAALLD